MKKFSFVFVLITSLGAGCCCSKGHKQQAGALFNGRDLAGWEMLHGGEWTVEDGVLVGRNGKDWSTNPEKSGSWLRTKRQYSDFVLELDYETDRLTTGYIGLQNHDAKSVVKFRDIRITEGN